MKRRADKKDGIETTEMKEHKEREGRQWSEGRGREEGKDK